MFGRFLPRETVFFDLFDKHAALSVLAACEFLTLVSSELDTSAITHYNRIKELEHNADIITHQCVEALHKTFITPIDRDEIHRLIARMDDIIDYIEAAADRMCLYKMKVATPEIKELANILLRAMQETERAIKGLRNLSNAKAIRQSCVIINNLENSADTVLRNAIVRLFEDEPETRTVIKWKEIYEDLENAIDRCEDVSNIIEGVILEYN